MTASFADLENAIETLLQPGPDEFCVVDLIRPYAVMLALGRVDGVSWEDLSRVICDLKIAGSPDRIIPAASLESAVLAALTRSA
jgi:hypothetical protein